MAVTKQNYNSTCCFVWVADIEGETSAEGIWEEGVEENIWTLEEQGNRGVEKTS
jgi:hypothetical protein